MKSVNASASWSPPRPTSRRRTRVDFPGEADEGSGRVVALPAPWVTAAHAFRRAPTPAPRPVLRDGVDRVLAARRVIAALPAQQAAEGDAVEQDELDQEPAHGRLARGASAVDS